MKDKDQLDILKASRFVFVNFTDLDATMVLFITPKSSGCYIEEGISETITVQKGLHLVSEVEGCYSPSADSQFGGDFMELVREHLIKMGATFDEALQAQMSKKWDGRTFEDFWNEGP